MLPATAGRSASPAGSSSSTRAKPGFSTGVANVEIEGVDSVKRRQPVGEGADLRRRSSTTSSRASGLPASTRRCGGRPLANAMERIAAASRPETAERAFPLARRDRLPAGRDAPGAGVRARARARAREARGDRIALYESAVRSGRSRRARSNCRERPGIQRLVSNRSRRSGSLARSCAAALGGIDVSTTSRILPREGAGRRSRSPRSLRGLDRGEPPARSLRHADLPRVQHRDGKRLS